MQIPFDAGWSQNPKIGDRPARPSPPEVAIPRWSAMHTASGTSFFPVKEHAEPLLRNVMPPNANSKWARFSI
jgi:hypothetical protein